jgi:hypothetical protein
MKIKGILLRAERHPKLSQQPLVISAILIRKASASQRQSSSAV